jgi:sulfite reductase alpha subunit-like flavoprotein
MAPSPHAFMPVQVLLLPEDPNAVLICVATGTGIAPYRSFWKRCFYEDVPGYKFTGLFWLFMGAANSDAKLYDDEIQVRALAWRQRHAQRTLASGAIAAGDAVPPLRRL